jgi:probable HAF family extracellular repeat protein
MVQFRFFVLMVAASLLAACGGGFSEASDPSPGDTMAKAMATTTVGSWQVTVQDLGLLPGGTTASARGINDAGQVIGTATDASYAINRVLWDAAASVLGAPSVAYIGSGAIEPTSLNDLGEIVGIHRISASQRQGDYWAGTQSAVVALMPLAGGSPYLTTARAINANGVITGSSPNSSGIITAVLWNRTGAPMSLQIAGEGLGINKSGHVVGVTGDLVTRGFLWRNGSKLELVSLGGSGSSARAVAVSDTGYIAGSSDNGTSAVRWTYSIDGSGSVTAEALPLPGDLVRPSPAAVNDAGDIVGTANSSFGRPRAILWRRGEAIPLAAFDSRAYGINDAGQIVGEGDIDGDGLNEALLWTVASGTKTTTTPPPPTTMNAAPVVAISSLTPTSLKIGGTVQLQGSFSDPDQGPWTFSIAWGDGSTSSGSMSAPGAITGSHLYTTASPKKGSFKVVLTVTDAGGASTSTPAVRVRVSR